MSEGPSIGDTTGMTTYQEDSTQVSNSSATHSSSSVSPPLSPSTPTNSLAEAQPATPTRSPDDLRAPDNSPQVGVEYSVQVYEIFTMETGLTILRPASSTSPVVDLAGHGFLGKTPVLPTVAVGFQTLELFHRLRLRKASFSVEAFTRMIGDYYAVSNLFADKMALTDSRFKIPYRRYLRTILAETYEIYVRMLNHINKRVMAVLGWDGPDWRAQNACRACCYKVCQSI